jgi:hypothetical protein
VVKNLCEAQEVKFWVSAEKNTKLYGSLLGKLKKETKGVDLEVCEHLIHYWRGRFMEPLKER